MDYTNIFKQIEWISLNIATGLMFMLDSHFGSIMTAIGVLSLAFFNIMRGIKILKELKTKRTRKHER